MGLDRRGFLRAAGTVAVAGVAGGFWRASGQAADAAKETSAAESLKAYAAKRGRSFGSAVDTSLLGRDEAYTRLIQQQCSVVVAENAMKMGPMRPAPDRYDFDGGDALVAFAEKNAMKVRGHNLCWHRQLPQWFEGYATKENARALLVEHIRTVATHYKGRIHSWDVVNEAVHIDDGRPDGLRESPWLKLIGPEYIELAFRTAREADPAALLTYNDYGIEDESSADSKKRATVLTLVRKLKSKQLIDAVGVQSHIRVGGSYGAGLAEFLRTTGSMGLEIYVTEMDVNDRSLPSDEAARDASVATAYGEYLDLILREKAVKSVLTWGITDAHTWLNGEDARADHLPERCLPFDAALKPVPAFYSIARSLSVS